MKPDVSPDQFAFSDEMADYVIELLCKASKALDASKKGSNVVLNINDVALGFPMRIDDIKILSIAGLLIPNVLNYLLNIIPQLLYPYIVAYLQNLSEMRDDPVVINELYDFIISYYGNIFNGSETQD